MSSCSAAIKRVLDLLLTSLGVLVASPAMAVIGVWIWVSDRGSILYRSTRVGRGGVAFEFLKFRSMVVGADKMGPSSTSGSDPRLTPCGRWLRRRKFDELPQLFNVIKGDLSLVGPRPQVPWIVERFSAEEREVLTVRPGVADYAFVLMPNEADQLRDSSDPDGDYMRFLHPEKMRLEIEYVRNRSLGLDLKVLVDALMLSLFGKCVFLREQRRASHSRVMEGWDAA